MLTFCRFLSGALLISLAALAGCTLFSSEAWQRPSPLSGPPPPPPEKSESHGGFNVLVSNPGQPTAAHAISDIESFARQRGFIRVSADPIQYTLGDIRLDVSYQTADLRVVANLHSFGSKLNRRFVDAFYRDFHQRYASQYGEHEAIYEDDYAD